MRVALITGITGQDGSYLAELLLEKGYISIGDTHTTRRLEDGMSEEETRFFGLKRECGLHENVSTDFNI